VHQHGGDKDIGCTIFVPEDETCFHLYEAISADAIREVAQRAELSFERVLEAIPSREE